MTESSRLYNLFGTLCFLCLLLLTGVVWLVAYKYPDIIKKIKLEGFNSPSNFTSASTSAPAALAGSTSSDNMIKDSIYAGASMIYNSYNNLAAAASSGVSLGYVPPGTFNLSKGDLYKPLGGLDLTNATSLDSTKAVESEDSVGSNLLSSDLPYSKTNQWKDIYLEISDFCNREYMNCLTLNLSQDCRKDYTNCMDLHWYSKQDSIEKAMSTFTDEQTEQTEQVGKTGKAASSYTTIVSGSPYSPSKVIIDPSQTPPVQQQTYTADTITDMGTQVDEILKNSMATPTIRQNIRQELQNSVNTYMKDIQRNVYEIDYVFQ
jgi:hypothetical protein